VPVVVAVPPTNAMSVKRLLLLAVVEGATPNRSSPILRRWLLP
jgi:hypothetical protein